LDSLGSTVLLGLGIILGGADWKAYLEMATSASVVATEDPMSVIFRASNRGIRAKRDSMTEVIDTALGNLDSKTTIL
jgi:hypothetical protein